MTESEVAAVCKAMGDENRLKILSLLTAGEKCACDLLAAFSITQPTLSHHMKILCEAGLVTVRKDGKWSHYAVNCPRFKEFKDFIAKMECAGTECSCTKNGEVCNG